MAFEGKNRGAVRVDLEISSQLIMSKDFLGRVIVCHHEPGCFFRDLLRKLERKPWERQRRIVCMRSTLWRTTAKRWVFCVGWNLSEGQDSNQPRISPDYGKRGNVRVWPHHHRRKQRYRSGGAFRLCPWQARICRFDCYMGACQRRTPLKDSTVYANEAYS